MFEECSGARLRDVAFQVQRPTEPPQKKSVGCIICASVRTGHRLISVRNPLRSQNLLLLRRNCPNICWATSATKAPARMSRSCLFWYRDSCQVQEGRVHPTPRVLKQPAPLPISPKIAKLLILAREALVREDETERAQQLSKFGHNTPRKNLPHGKPQNYNNYNCFSRLPHHGFWAPGHAQPAGAQPRSRQGPPGAAPAAPAASSLTEYVCVCACRFVACLSLLVWVSWSIAFLVI